MNKHTWAGIFAGILFCLGMVSCNKTSEAETARVDLLSNSWKLIMTEKASAILNATIPEDTLRAPVEMDKGFTIQCKTNLVVPTSDRLILEIPGILDVRLKQNNPEDRGQQNYPAYRMPDGSVPVLEAGLALQSSVDGKVERMVTGIPLAILKEPWGTHEIVLTFSGVRWTMYVDGQLLDNDFPIGYPPAGMMNRWNINPDFVKEARIYYPAVQSVRIEKKDSVASAQMLFWTPDGHNAWVGDVVSLYHDGRYHLFYLYDRRGHGSKFGRGGHYFEHLSTSDFRHWTEHEAAVPIDEQWETIGTGTPFVFDGHLCISYGYHTTRIYPREQTALPVQYAYLEKEGHTGSFDRRRLSSVAAGSSYSVSDDGIHFLKTDILFHPCENPSIYVDPEGKLKMLANYGARGTWASDSVSGGWHCIDDNFPTGGDCTFFFHWGDYEYIIGGFTRLWSKHKKQPDSSYQDVVAKGLDFYNGLCVPTVTAIPDGRYLMAGWIWMKSWGGPLVIHEMVQLPDGRIGTKWMDELLPATEPATGTFLKNPDEVETLPSSSFMLSFDVTPTGSGAKLGLTLLPGKEKGMQDACDWLLDIANKRAQYSQGTAYEKNIRERSLREGGAPQQGRNYAIENLIDIDSTFTVRMIVKASDKFDGSMIDTEIAGKRTMISYREKLFARRLQFHPEEIKIENLKITPLVQ